MNMRFVGVGVYHHGPSGIEKPGDFGYRVDMIDGIEQWQFVQHCPKTGVCFQKIHRAHAVMGPQGPIWEWDGNLERPTLIPSIGCDSKQRCGQHVVVSHGTIIGNTPRKEYQ